jgi:hypothetical protein
MDSHLHDRGARPLRAAGSILAGAVIVALKGARYTAFYLLMWLRVIVAPVSNACAFLGLIGLCLAALLVGDKTLVWRLGLFSFGAFVVGWVYDGLLLVLSPRPLVLSNGTVDR